MKRLGEVYLFHLVQDFDQSITLDNLATLAIREEPLHQVIVELVRIGSLGEQVLDCHGLESDGATMEA